MTPATTKWQDWASFALGFSSAYVAMVNCIMVGAFVAFLAAPALSLEKELSKVRHRL